jgi:hypothetical protein
MTLRFSLGCLFYLCLMPWHNAMAQLDGSVPLVCTSFEVLECEQAHDCNRHPPDGVVIPYFFKIDFSKKTVATSAVKGHHKVSAIKNVESNGGRLLVQGTDEGHAWSLILVQDTAKMVLTIAGDNYGFVVFGACTSM